MNDTENQACPRIYTRCPACHNDTLTINKGHLLCTWHECKDPTLIDRLGESERAGGRKPEPSAEAGDKHIALQGLVSRLEQELSDTKALLRFQEMHKSAEMLKDKSRLDWLLKESHIRFDTMDGCLYATCRQTIDDQMRAAEPANVQVERPAKIP